MSSIPPTKLSDAIMIASSSVTAQVTRGMELLKTEETEDLIKITILSATPQGLIRMSTPKGDVTAQTSLETPNFLRSGQSYNLQVLNGGNNNITIILRPLNLPQKLPKDVPSNIQKGLKSNLYQLNVGLVTTATIFPQSTSINAKLEKQNSASVKAAISEHSTPNYDPKNPYKRGKQHNITDSTVTQTLPKNASPLFLKTGVTDKHSRNSEDSVHKRNAIFEHNPAISTPFVQKQNQSKLNSEEPVFPNQFTNERLFPKTDLPNATGPTKTAEESNRSQIISNKEKRYDSNIKFNYNVANSTTEDNLTGNGMKDDPNVGDKLHPAHQTITQIPSKNDKILGKASANSPATKLNSPEPKLTAIKQARSHNQTQPFDPIKNIPQPNGETNPLKTSVEIASDKNNREPSQQPLPPQKVGIRIISIHAHENFPKKRVQPGVNSVIRTTLAGTASNGQIILSSSQGLITLPHQTDLPIGTNIDIELTHPIPHYSETSKSIPPAPLKQLASKWENLEQTVHYLGMSNPATSAQILQNNVITIGPQMLASLIQFIVAIRNGDLRSWLGRDTTRNVDQLRIPYGKSLQTEFQTLKQASEPSESGWRAFFMPVLAQENLHQLRFFIYKNNDNDPGSGKNSRNTRFIVEVNLSRIGELQIDGRVKSKSIQILIRTKQPFSEKIKQELYEIFENTIKRTGITGYLTFRVQKTFPVLPIQELTGYQEGSTSDLHI